MYRSELVEAFYFITKKKVVDKVVVLYDHHFFRQLAVVAGVRVYRIRYRIRQLAVAINWKEEIKVKL